MNKQDRVVYVPIEGFEEFGKYQEITNAVSYPMLSEKGMVHQMFRFEVEARYEKGWKVLKPITVSELLKEEGGDLVTGNSNSNPEFPASHTSGSLSANEQRNTTMTCIHCGYSGSFQIHSEFMKNNDHDDFEDAKLVQIVHCKSCADSFSLKEWCEKVPLIAK